MTYYIVFNKEFYIGTESDFPENVAEIIALDSETEKEALSEMLDLLFDGIGADIEFSVVHMTAEEDLPTETLALI